MSIIDNHTFQIEEVTYDQVVIGSGAAGLASALRLWELGENKTALITDNINAGTSRNTGSDKQTYYKLSIAGADQDSVIKMAEDIFAGGAMDGDIALCEAASSTRAFMKLVELGVEFPRNEYGEFIGYRTDHDRGKRATSVGPYTSKKMTEALERGVRATSIDILDRHQAIKLLVRNEKVYGVLCYLSESDAFKIIWTGNVILATGGPAGIYHDSVYPQSQLGSSGMAFEAGVSGKNLTEWQFGMASIRPRWNVSGSYMQALPRFLSTDREGNSPREFLLDYFADRYEMLSNVFLKGYQWPFDVDKLWNGSSIIDLLVYREIKMFNRRVFLDYSENSGCCPISFDHVSEEARNYLHSTMADFGKPIDRLAKMNRPAVNFYKEHGTDLYKEPLEIAICAQHNNGGLSTDTNWETDIEGIFAVGEVNGSHGIRRPGGSALNSGQVGAIRVSEAIHNKKLKSGLPRLFDSQMIQNELREKAAEYVAFSLRAHGSHSIAELREWYSSKMSEVGGIIRDVDSINELLSDVSNTIDSLDESVSVSSPAERSLFFRLRDQLITIKVYLYAMTDYKRHGVGSRGSALYTDCDGSKSGRSLPEEFCFVSDADRHSGEIQVVAMNKEGEVKSSWRNVRPIPVGNNAFEIEWEKFRKSFQ